MYYDETNPKHRWRLAASILVFIFLASLVGGYFREEELKKLPPEEAQWLKDGLSLDEIEEQKMINATKGVESGLGGTDLSKRSEYKVPKSESPTPKFKDSQRQEHAPLEPDTPRE